MPTESQSGENKEINSKLKIAVHLLWPIGGIRFFVGIVLGTAMSEILTGSYLSLKSIFQIIGSVFFIIGLVLVGIGISIEVFFLKGKEIIEALKMDEGEKAKLKRRARILLMVILVFIILIAILLLIGTYTDWVIIEIK